MFQKVYIVQKKLRYEMPPIRNLKYKWTIKEKEMKENMKIIS